MTDPHTPFLPPQVAALLASNRKVEAVKLVIDSNPGLKLRAAKDAVEEFARRMRAGEVAAPSPSPSRSGDASENGLPEAARTAARAGQKVLAVKIVRDAYGLDLRTAKQRVDAYMQGGVSGDDEDGDAIGDGDDELPAQVVALLLTGDRARASLLLQSQYACSPSDSLARIARYEVSRKRRGFGDGSGRVPTVSAGDGSGRTLGLALLLAIVAAVIVAVMAFYGVFNGSKVP